MNKSNTIVEWVMSDATMPAERNELRAELAEIEQ